MKLATFDIFDTTLIRRCGQPDVIFELLAQRLYPDNAAAREALIHWRKHQAKGETIAEKYASATADFSEYTVDRLIDAEMAIESEQLTVNPQIKSVIQQRRAEGYTIKYVSDMYLPSSMLSSVLRREGCLEDGEEVIVSCEHNARKDTGTLYDEIRQKYCPTEWHHYGDNIKSDIKQAKKKGIKAHQVNTSYTDIERYLNNKARKMLNGWQLMMLVGAMRTYRIKNGCTPEVTLAANYVIPTYLPYVMHTLNDAQSRGLDKLYFLSRDGYIMHEIAKALPAIGTELRYLFVSRKSLSGDRDMLHRYLKQEGLDKGHNGAVDIGWRGSSRKMINEAIREIGGNDIITYYIGVCSDVLPRRDGEFMHYYRLGLLDTIGATSLIESYLSASPWPTTIGYAADDGDIKPIFPNGTQYNDTPVTLAAVGAARHLSKTITEIGDVDAEILRLWSEHAINSLSKMTYKVDLSPMQTLMGVNDKQLVKKIGIAGLIDMLILGNHVSGFDRGSLEHTLGHRAAKTLWPLHLKTARLRSIIYNRLSNRKNRK